MMTEVYRKRLCSMVHFRVPQLFSLYFQHSLRSLYQKTIMFYGTFQGSPVIFTLLSTFHTFAVPENDYHRK
jgi:hypothetical protein